MIKDTKIRITLSLNKLIESYLRSWAKEHNMTVSEAVNKAFFPAAWDYFCKDPEDFKKEHLDEKR